MKPAKTKSGVIDLRMLKPQRIVSKGKGIGKGDVPAIPPPGMSPRSFWAFNLFMRDFRKTDELESMIMKACNEKWNSMTESERGFYEDRLDERTRQFDQYCQIYEKLQENVDEAGGDSGASREGGTSE